VPNAWSKYNTGEFIGTIAFAYLCFIMFMLFFFCLIIFQSGVSEELGISKFGTGAKEVQAGSLRICKNELSPFHQHINAFI
jgi:hypothetical protein